MAPQKEEPVVIPESTPPPAIIEIEAAAISNEQPTVIELGTAAVSNEEPTVIEMETVISEAPEITYSSDSAQHVEELPPSRLCKERFWIEGDYLLAWEKDEEE